MPNDMLHRLDRSQTTNSVFSAKYLLLAVSLVSTLTWIACESLEVEDYNNGFRPAPTVERAPTIETAPTVTAAPSVTKFEGFETAPTAETFDGFKPAPTTTTFEGFNQAPTVTKFQGFNEDENNPCAIFLENPTPANAKQAAEWAMGYLDGAGGEIDPNDGLHVTASCNAVLNNLP